MKKIFLTIVIAIMVLSAGLPVFAADAQTGFSDISTHWAKAAIEKYADPAFFAGKDGSFSPNKPITRGEFVMLLHKAVDVKIKYVKAPDITEFFSDVSNDAPYAAKLYDLVVINAIEKKAEFKPDEILPRDEMIHYIVNSLKSVTGGNYAIIKMMPAPFADDDKITAAYKNDIVEAVLLKIVQGRGSNQFFPQSGATRAEAAVAAARLMDTAKKFAAPVQIVPSVEKTSNGLTMKLTVTNISDHEVTIHHSSGQKVDFKLFDAQNNNLYTWSADKSFIMALSSTVIEAGKSVEFKETLDGDGFNSIKDKVKLMRAYLVGELDGFPVNPDGYEAEIQ